MKRQKNLSQTFYIVYYIIQFYNRETEQLLCLTSYAFINLYTLKLKSIIQAELLYCGNIVRTLIKLCAIQAKVLYCALYSGGFNVTQDNSNRTPIMM